MISTMKKMGIVRFDERAKEGLSEEGRLKQSTFAGKVKIKLIYFSNNSFKNCHP